MSDIASDVPCVFFTQGPIPESIGQLQALVDLQLWNNKHSGSFSPISTRILDSHSDLPLLFFLKTCALPAHIGSPGCLPNLKSLNVNGNPDLGGEIDASFLAN
jgi:hypothetical protein